jgi:hypothetical protein
MMSSGVIRIGVDFDNTIVSYDQLFHKVALEKGLVPDGLPANKSEIRNYLRKVGREDEWTAMQGYVYGARMSEAVPFSGVLDFFKTCRAQGVEVRIISHKTRRPYAGEPYDLHAAAEEWLELQGFFDPSRIGLPRADVFFEATKEGKLERIQQCQCQWFVDDLPEFLSEPAFPRDVQRVLFDPGNLYGDETRFRRMQQWRQSRDLFSLQWNSR